MRRFTGISLLLVGLVATTRAATLHVDPLGEDHQPGTLDQPLATLNAAIRASRRLPPTEPHRIVVHSGVYEDTSVTLGPEDSGLEIVAGPGPKPRLLGGRIIRQWTRDGDRFWSAPTPAAKGVDPTARGIRSLLVDGELAPRARFPQEGTLEHETRFEVAWMSTTGGGWQRRPTAVELTTLRYRPDDLPRELDLSAAEITIYHMWDESCVGVAGNDAATRTLRLDPPTGHPPGAFGVRRYVLWNLREGLTSPGQWYEDRPRNRLVFYPAAGTDPASLEVVAPTTFTILTLRGTRDAPVTNVLIRGLEFSATTVPLVAGGFGAAAYPGAIELDNARDCRLEGLTLRGVAGQGIKASDQVAGIRVARSEVTQCGAGGIYLGGREAVIEDNHVHAIGRQYPSAIGIFRGGTDCVVRHNEVHDCSYSAINYGGTRNQVTDNLLYDCMKALHDGAGIYMFAATNCLLRGNLARDIVDTGGYGASAYYLDERSTGCVVEHNVAVGVGWPSHHHMATNNIVRNNLFLVEGDAKLTFPRSADTTLAHNLVYATGKIRIENIDAVTRWDRNLFFSGSGRIEQVKLDRYTSREAALGPPGDTVIADPQLRDWRNGDFTWGPDSPAQRLGIQPVDVSQAGPRAPGIASPSPRAAGIYARSTPPPRSRPCPSGHGPG